MTGRKDSATAPSAPCSFPVQRRPPLLLTDATTALRYAPSTVAQQPLWPLCPASLHGPRPWRSTWPSPRTAERRLHALLQRRPSSRPSRSRRHQPQAAPLSFSDRRPQARRPPSTGSGPSRRRGPRPARAPRASAAASRGDFNTVPWPSADLRPRPPSVHAWALLYRLNEHRAGEARMPREKRGQGPSGVRGRMRTRRGHVEQRLAHAPCKPLCSPRPMGGPLLLAPLPCPLVLSSSTPSGNGTGGVRRRRGRPSTRSHSCSSLCCVRRRRALSVARARRSLPVRRPLPCCSFPAAMPRSSAPSLVSACAPSPPLLQPRSR